MTSLRGHLLLASPSLQDPSFRRSVVLITEHNEEGAMGLVLNRPATATVGDVAPDLACIVDPDEPLWVGGPVQPTAIMVLAEFERPERAAAIVRGDLGFVPGGADLEDLGDVTRRARVFAGYAGWSPSQLESELERSDWIVDEPAPGEILGDDAASLWQVVLERKGGRFRLVARMPDDPSLN